MPVLWELPARVFRHNGTTKRKEITMGTLGTEMILEKVIEGEIFDKVKCKSCGNDKFEILVNKYEVHAQCAKCAFYFLVLAE